MTQDQWMKEAEALIAKWGKCLILGGHADGTEYADILAHLQQRPLPVREGADKQLPLVPTSHMLNASVNAWHSWKARDTGGCIQALGRLMWECMADAAPNAGDWDASPPLPVREEPTGADAERYRWLRHAVMSEDQTPFVDALEAINLNPQTTDEFDATVDAARAASPSVQNMGEGETGKDGVDLPDGGQRGT